MERRSPVFLALFALLLLLPAAAPRAAQPAAEPGLIQVADDQGVHRFTLPEALDFLRHGYTDLGQVRDPLSYAHDLCLRGKVLAYFLGHSAELAQAGFFEAKGAAVQQATAASLNPEFVSPDLACALTAKDVMALHAVVYATSGPALYEQFLAVAGAALEGKDYTYLAQLRSYALEAAEQIGQVRALSGMYGEPKAGVAAACATQQAQPCAKPPGEHACSQKCSGARQTEGGKCSGACSSQGEGEPAHKCAGTCQTEGGKCSGTCSRHQGEGEPAHKCAGTCQTEGGKCPGTCRGVSGQGASLGPKGVVPVN